VSEHRFTSCNGAALALIDLLVPFMPAASPKVHRELPSQLRTMSAVTGRSGSHSTLDNSTSSELTRAKEAKTNRSLIGDDMVTLYVL
jgi:hypothetical protein